MALTYPSIDVTKKSNEENLQATKSYLYETADQINYQLNMMNDYIMTLEARLNALEGKEE